MLSYLQQLRGQRLPDRSETPTPSASDDSLVPSPLPVPLPLPPPRPPPPSTIYPHPRSRPPSALRAYSDTSSDTSSSGPDRQFTFRLTSRRHSFRPTTSTSWFPFLNRRLSHDVSHRRLAFTDAPERRNSEMNPTPTRPTTNVHVSRWVLEGNGGGLRREGKWAAMGKQSLGKRTVAVEANAFGLSQTVLYASEAMSHSHADLAYQETEFITIDSEQYVYKDWVVYEDSPFEISVVGMSISPFDFGFGKPKNEVLLYSMQREEGEQGDDVDVLPIIHHDPLVDSLGGSKPDTFTPIAASKSLFMASDGSEPRKFINCRFKIFELDDVTEAMRRSIAGIQQLGSQISNFLNATPALGLLSPALSLASSVARQALDSHAKPDQVLTIDTNFLLAKRSREQGDNVHFIHQTGEYLRYGYYFFLSEKVDAKLYVSFKTFPNVELMMMRTDVDDMRPNEKKFFPLTGVSYLVLRVTRRLTTGKNTRRPVRLRHINRLEQLFKTVQSEGVDAEHVRNSLRELALEVGYVPKKACHAQGNAQQSSSQPTPQPTPQATPQATPQPSPAPSRASADRPTENGLASRQYQNATANEGYQEVYGRTEAYSEGAYGQIEGMTNNTAEDYAAVQTAAPQRDRCDYDGGFGASLYDVDTGHGDTLHGVDHEFDPIRASFVTRDDAAASIGDSRISSEQAEQPDIVQMLWQDEKGEEARKQ